MQSEIPHITRLRITIRRHKHGVGQFYPAKKPYERLGRCSHQAERMSIDSAVHELDRFSQNISKAVKNRPETCGIGRIVANGF
jgi:hypothetical protein